MKGIKISTKFLLSMLLISLIAIIIIFSYSYRKTKSTYIDSALKELQYITQINKSSLEELYNRYDKAIDNISNSYKTKQILKQLNTFVRSKIDTNSFIFENLSDTLKGTYNSYTRYLEKYASENNLENIILISNQDGLILYNKKNKNNIGCILNNVAATKNDPIEQIWRETVNNGKPVLKDFQKYQSSLDYKSYWAFPVKENNENISSVMVVEIPAWIIDSTTQKTKAFGKTFEILIVGNDYILRNNSRLFKNQTAFLQEIKTGDVTEAFASMRGIKIIKDYRGTNVLSSYTPLNIEGLSWVLISKVDVKDLFSPLDHTRRNLLMLTVIIIFLVFIVFLLLSNYITRPLVETKQKLISLCNGILPKEKVTYKWKDEIGEMTQAVNTLIDNLRNTANFANQIGSGDLTANYDSISNDDELGNSLLEMRDSLQRAADEERKRKKEEEQRSWTTHGVAMFAEILRQNNNDIKILSYNIIKNMVEYLNANQGGMFLLNEDSNKKKYLSLEAAFAYSRQKFLKKRIEWGEGIIGATVQEAESVFLTDVPDTYMEITSGLGEANPRCLLIVPLKVNEEIFGALEIASFNTLEQYQIEFVEKVAESIGSTISTVRINMQTAHLLEESQKQAEKLAQQEEEMRQNLEEMQATQEELAREQTESKGILNALRTSTYIIEYDLDGKITDVNKPYLDMLEIRKKDLLGKDIRDGLKFDESRLNTDSGIEQFWESIVKGETQTVISKVFNAERKYMQEIWLQETYTPILNEMGDPVKVIKIAFDITATKNKEADASKRDLQQQIEIERLRAENNNKVKEVELKSEEVTAQQNAINNMLPCFTMDMDGYILTANEMFLQVMGYESVEMERKNYKTFCNPEIINSPKHVLFWKQLKAGNPQAGIFTFISKDKNELLLEMTFTPIYIDNKAEKIIAIGIDVTDQKYETNDLRGQIEAVGRFATITELTPEGTITKINNMFEQVLGYDKADAIGKNHSAFMDEDTRVSVTYVKFWDRLKKGDYISGEYAKITKSGNKLWMYCTLHPIMDLNGSIYKVVEIAFDISKYK